MKKIGLLCAALLACGSLAGCGLQKHQGDKEAASISKLKSENSSLKAKKSSHHKHKKTKASSKATTTDSSTTESTQGKGSAKDPKEEEAAKNMRDYDPEWWDSLSPEEQQYWAHHTAYSGNEDFMYAPGLYEKHLIQEQPTPSNSGNGGYIDYRSYGNSGAGQSAGNATGGPSTQPTTGGNQ
jgi:hypothetical protein